MQIDKYYLTLAIVAISLNVMKITIIEGKIMFARLFMQYMYKVEKGWKKEGNIGDCVQNIAVENLYKKAGISADELVLVNRDGLSDYDGEPVKLVMQAYFAEAYGYYPFPWSKKITPIFLGFHLNSTNNSRKIFMKKGIYKDLKPFEPIGCRDRNTRDFLISKGINAYFSGCMTLTMDKREKAPENGKIFVVDLYKQALKRLPKEISDKADFSITHIYKWNKDKITQEDAIEFENRAREILEIYKTQAALVITSRIHVAMPCIAMGIPVVFIAKNVNNERYDILQGIVPIYDYRDLKYINWNPSAPNIDDLKNAIISNAVAQIKESPDREQKIKELGDITSKMLPIRYLPTWLHFIRKIQYGIKRLF